MHGAIVELAQYRPVTAKVSGSIPDGSAEGGCRFESCTIRETRSLAQRWSNLTFFDTRVAQLVEHQSPKLRVIGSTPVFCAGRGWQRAKPVVLRKEIPKLGKASQMEYQNGNTRRPFKMKR